MGDETYWGHHGTTAGEACVYVGVVPLILAFVGLVAAPRERVLGPWRLVAALTLGLATMPGWWPDGFYFLLHLPGVGLVPRPGALHAADRPGPGAVRGPGARPGPVGLTAAVLGRAALAVAFGGLAWAWSILAAQGAEFRAAMGAIRSSRGSPGRPSPGRWAWWRSSPGGADASGRGAPVALAGLELGVLFFAGPTWWGWAVRLSESSPVLRRLAETGETGLVAGRLLNVPVVAGLTTAFPDLGIMPPPPNYLIEVREAPPG